MGVGARPDADGGHHESFAERGLFAFVRTGWSEIVMADPRL
ncbi:hypothetical protein ACOCJ4_06650 [Knoellia sp. CPCC 206435]